MDPRDHKGDEGVAEGAEDGMTGESMAKQNSLTEIVYAELSSGCGICFLNVSRYDNVELPFARCL